ncbi:TRADD-N-associated membrane domain-containing protein [Streptomyces sp. BRA346]|uniref:TRADD-N-associated membrane domain-containing protein n=1 Tax=Streptomyces sp. BRA346 TaxID=2878199 RepID=UPI004063999E
MERKNALLCAAWVIFIMAICGALLSVLFNAGWRIAVTLAIVGVLLSFALAAGARYVYRYAQVTFVPTSAREEDGDESHRILEEPGLQNLITLNRAQMQVYHEIATKQARLASRNSRWAIAIGYTVLVAGAIVAIRSGSETSKIVIGALALVGSLLSAYISRTFSQSEDRAMDQLNYYFRQPLVTSYVLSAERLTFRLEDGRRDELVTEVVQGVLSAAQNAYDGEVGRDQSREVLLTDDTENGTAPSAEKTPHWWSKRKG